MKKLVHQDIYGMSRAGKIQADGDTYEIYVNTDDSGKIPHFHFRTINDWKKFHSCIRIDSARYFLHSNKDDRLNAKQKKELQHFMQEPASANIYDETGNKINNWQYICILWNGNNSDVMIERNIEQPDYSQLK